MLDGFKKNKNEVVFDKSKKAEIIKKAYELGFEVGYHKHSEIGWVKINYSKLDDLSKNSGLGDLAYTNYKKGKEEGILSREKGLTIGSQTSGSSDSAPLSIPYEQVTEEKIGSGFKREQVNQDRVDAPVKQPELLDLPAATSLTKAIDRPSNINGFKPLMRHNK
ncbi:MAG: hypothetical protein K8R64_05995 [Methanosarcinaceae archaeon]|nr:hypothetical protein [Methanosarcinaceae archaeon]